MLTRWSDFDRAALLMDELRRRMDRVFDDLDGWHAPRALDADRFLGVGAAWPRMNLLDAGSTLVLQADVPGMTEKDLRLSINQDVVTLEGERKADAPEGYSVHRKERAQARFSRSFTLPCKVDAERTTAAIKDGVLTVRLAKAPEAQPRQIAVRAE